MSAPMHVSRPLVFFLMMSVSSGAQVYKLEASNPAPRVGEEVTISFRIERETNQEEDEKNPLEKLFNSSRNAIGKGQFELSSWFLDEMGPIHIGPFQISIDNKVYLTNSIILNVQGKLPDDIPDGVWVRLVTIDSVNYMVLEQRATAIETHSKNENNMTWSMSTPDIDWADLTVRN
jgi:hypothetical protein